MPDRYCRQMDCASHKHLQDSGVHQNGREHVLAYDSSLVSFVRTHIYRRVRRFPPPPTKRKLSIYRHCPCRRRAALRSPIDTAPPPARRPPAAAPAPPTGAPPPPAFSRLRPTPSSASAPRLLPPPPPAFFCLLPPPPCLGPSLTEPPPALPGAVGGGGGGAPH